MKHSQQSISRVPTNIITGFLGVGKTTVILNLLKQKSVNERWAVLVNEFGEIGVDGGLIQGGHSESDGIYVREVPGGCMCCAAGLPMQIALNQLLTRAKPDRLLIEPTGLGHPKEVLEVLSAEHYQDVLNIQQCITLVDARKIADTRYTEHETFNQQIDMADVIVGHKADLYSEKSQQELIDYVTSRRDQSVPIHFAVKGNVDTAVLSGKSIVAKNLKHHHHHNHSMNPAANANDQEIPESGFLRVENSGEAYQSIGWRFSPDKLFNRTALFAWLSGLGVERAKGVFITREGVFGYNLTSDTMTEMELDDCSESRLEIIFRGSKLVDENELLQCIEK
ncbi:GTPase, G3E family [Alteromonadaceae bacterium Bs31]|nr:GTPase, G3E family [Alteromonadaceae bacterium Bs31]